MTRLLEIGLTGLSAHQRALSTTGHNITNANVDGYSRQEVSFATRDAQLRGDVYTGSGVFIDGIRRITDQFIVSQSFVDTARVNELDALDSGLSQLDLLLSGDDTGLTTSLNDLFASLQAVTESPSSIVLRDQVLNGIERYLDRFDSVVGQIQVVGNQVDEALQVQVGQVNSLAEGIAELNLRISQAAASSNGTQPNDLLDQRDRLLKELSTYVEFSTINDGSGAINVFIGRGQALVLESTSTPLVALSPIGENSSVEIAIDTRGTDQIITSSISGGQLGGLLALRDNGVDSALEQLGLMHTQLVQSFNSLHRQGVDLNGNSGGNLFTDINTAEIAQARVVPGSGNFDTSSVTSVTIEQASLLQNSDYSLSLSDVSGLLGYTVVRNSDGETVGQGTVPNILPQNITTSDGFSVNLEEGLFRAGDTFTLRPSFVSPGRITLQVSTPESLALGLPVTTLAASGNLGLGSIDQVSSDNVVQLSQSDLDSVAALRAASPSLVIRFTSATSYDILDNSNPAQPVDLVPPLRDFSFIPGQSNSVLSASPGSTLYSTVAGSSPFSPVVGAIGSTNNGYAGETITINSNDLIAGTVSTQTIVAQANESAASLSARLNAAEGVTATAGTSLALTVSDDAAGTPLELRLNGIELTSAAIGTVPSPVTADFLAERINSLLGSSGVVAQSDGTQLSIRSVSGEDLVIENFSAGGDSVALTEVNGSTLGVPASINASQEASVGGVVTVIVEDQVSLESSGGLLGGASVQELPAFIGYDIAISGQPAAGDEFFVTLGESGEGDNRTARALAGLQTADITSNGSTLLEVYSTLVGSIGNQAGAVAIDKEAAESILAQTEDRLASISGVNLDEEAARLLQYEQAYNASARVISVARTLFDSLLAAFN